MLNFGIITDEVYQDDFERSVQFGLSRGIDKFELRRAFNNRVPLFDKEQKDLIKRIVKEYKITLTGISPGVFKVTLHDHEIEYHAEKLLSKSFDFAEEFGIYKVIIFGVKRGAEDVLTDYERVLNYLGEAAYQAQKRGLTLCIENEPGWWADTYENTLKVLEALQDTGIMLNFDPGNFIVAGEKDCLKIYELLKKYIANVHLKDVLLTPNGKKSVPLGQGSVGWGNLLRRMSDDNFLVNLSIETHCTPLLENTITGLDFIEMEGLYKKK